MQVVINIDDKLYEAILDGWWPDMNISVKHLIEKGTLLPKGHGRLIDADALYDEYVKEPEEFNGGHSLMALFRVAPTIVEADRSEREDKV